MQFDVALPSAVFLIIAASVLSYRRIEKSFTPLLEDKKYSTRDVILMVVAMGLMVSVIAFLPGQAIQIGFIGAYLYMLFVFAYITSKKWYLALLAPITFLVCYFYFWHLAVFNLFVVVFAVIITVQMSSLFTWKSVGAFAAILTIMDIFHVYVTGFMKQAAIEMIELKLPVLLILPRVPSGNLIGLGLGDLFLGGLLAVQTAKKLGQKTGILVATMNGVAMFIFEIISLNTNFAEFFPATIIVVAAWLASLAIVWLTTFRQNHQLKKT
jgi:hypothetical protein